MPSCKPRRSLKISAFSNVMRLSARILEMVDVPCLIPFSFVLGIVCTCGLILLIFMTVTLSRMLIVYFHIAMGIRLMPL